LQRSSSEAGMTIFPCRINDRWYFICFTHKTLILVRSSFKACFTSLTMLLKASAGDRSMLFHMPVDTLSSNDISNLFPYLGF
jgi:hypothetical protein